MQIRFGITDERREYMVDYLGGWKAMAISTYERGKRGVTKLDVVNLVLEQGREYDLVLAVRGTFRYHLRKRETRQPVDARSESERSDCAGHLGDITRLLDSGIRRFAITTDAHEP